MRIAEYKRIDKKLIKRTVSVNDYDENGEIIGQHEETFTDEKPIMGIVYRDASADEEAELLRKQKEMEEYERDRPLTAEERLEMLEDAFAELCEVMFNG